MLKDVHFDFKKLYHVYMWYFTNGFPLCRFCEAAACWGAQLIFVLDAPSVAAEKKEKLEKTKLFDKDNQISANKMRIPV